MPSEVVPLDWQLLVGHEVVEEHSLLHPLDSLQLQPLDEDLLQLQPLDEDLSQLQLLEEVDDLQLVVQILQVAELDEQSPHVLEEVQEEDDDDLQEVSVQFDDSQVPAD